MSDRYVCGTNPMIDKIQNRNPIIREILKCALRKKMRESDLRVVRGKLPFYNIFN